MADRYGFFINNGSSGGGRSMRDEDFSEEDVWAVVKEEKDSSLKVKKSKDTSSVSTLRRLPTASRMIPKADKSSSHETKVHQQSAPVNIPDWSKIYRKSSKKGSHSSWAEDDGDGDEEVIVDEDDEEEDDDDDDDGDRVPPHEWIAMKHARSQISSFSVFEGVGRTLKGRDLSKVRNAVLTRTGFLEYNPSSPPF